MHSMNMCIAYAFGRSSTTPSPRGSRDIPSSGRRDRQPDLRTNRTRFPSPTQGRHRHPDRGPANTHPDRSARSPRAGSLKGRSTGRNRRIRPRRQPSRHRRHRSRSRASRRSRSRSRQSARRRPARSASSSTARIVGTRRTNHSAGDLGRVFRNDLMRKHAFIGFTRPVCSWAARNFGVSDIARSIPLGTWTRANARFFYPMFPRAMIVAGIGCRACV